MNKKIVLIIAVAIIGILVGGVYFLGEPPKEEVINLTLSEDMDGNYNPIGETTEFEEGSMVFLTGDIKSPNPDTELYTIWYGPDDQIIWNFEDDTFDEAFWIGEIGEDEDPQDYIYDIFWHIGPPDHQWEEGEHIIEVILNEEVVETLTFEIETHAEEE